jgi:hypothetical protein
VLVLVLLRVSKVRELGSVGAWSLDATKWASGRLLLCDINTSTYGRLVLSSCIVSGFRRPVLCRGNVGSSRSRRHLLGMLALMTLVVR